MAATAPTNPSAPRTPTSAWNIRHVSPRKPAPDSSASTRSNVSEVLPPLNDQNSWPDMCDNLARGRVSTQTVTASNQAESNPTSPACRAASRSKKQKWVQIAPAELQAAADAAAAAVRQPQQRRNGHQRSMSSGGARGGQAGHRPTQAPQLVPPVPPLPVPAGSFTPNSLDDVFVVRTQPQIHASSASISSSASANASTRGSVAGTHSTRTTSPSSSLASLPPTSASVGDPAEKTSPSVALAQLPSSTAATAPHDRHNASLIDHPTATLHNGVAIGPSRSGRVVFGSVEESSLGPSEGAPAALDLLAMHLNRPPPMRPTAGPQLVQSRRSSDELVPKLSALTINRGSASTSTGSTGSGSVRGEGDSSPALSARTGTSLSFFADNPLEPGHLPRTPLEPAFELPPAAPWTPHSIGQDTPPGALQHEQGQPWKQHKQRSSSSSSSLHSRYNYAQQMQWDLAAPRETSSDKRTAARRDRDHGNDRDTGADTGDRDVFEVDYSRHPRHQEMPPAPREPDVFVSRRDRERDGSTRYNSSRTREGTDITSQAGRGRRNSFARGGGRGGGARSHSQPFDTLTTSPASGISERGGRGRGRGGYRGSHREHVNRDVGEGFYDHRRPPSPESTLTSTFWDSGTLMSTGITRVNFGEGLPLPIPRTVVRVGEGGFVTPTQYFVLGQLEFYFSARNLQRDVFMRQQMDSRGWVPLTLVASFKRLHALIGGSMPLLRDAAALSEVVEISGNYIRLRDGAWGPWVLPSAARSVVDEEQSPVIDSGLPDIEVIEGRRIVVAERGGADTDDEEDEESDDDIVFVMSAVD